jgi:hypothetical protein
MRDESKNTVMEELLFTVVYLDNTLFLEELISNCQNKHVQQVAYSTYHKALTQLCFDCQKIRTTMPMTSEPKEDL